MIRFNHTFHNIFYEVWQEINEDATYNTLMFTFTELSIMQIISPYCSASPNFA